MVEFGQQLFAFGDDVRTFRMFHVEREHNTRGDKIAAVGRAIHAMAVQFQVGLGGSNLKVHRAAHTLSMIRGLMIRRIGFGGKVSGHGVRCRCVLASFFAFLGYLLAEFMRSFLVVPRLGMGVVKHIVRPESAWQAEFSMEFRIT